MLIMFAAPFCMHSGGFCDACSRFCSLSSRCFVCLLVCNDCEHYDSNCEDRCSDDSTPNKTTAPPSLGVVTGSAGREQVSDLCILSEFACRFGLTPKLSIGKLDRIKQPASASSTLHP